MYIFKRKKKKKRVHDQIKVSYDFEEQHFAIMFATFHNIH